MVPGTGGLNSRYHRNRTLAKGRSLDWGLFQEIKHPQVAADPSPETVVGIR